jgi:hypothetical protein
MSINRDTNFGVFLVLFCFPFLVIFVFSSLYDFIKNKINKVRGKTELKFKKEKYLSNENIV